MLTTGRQSGLSCGYHADRIVLELLVMGALVFLTGTAAPPSI
jgi:hypothetical protein